MKFSILFRFLGSKQQKGKKSTEHAVQIVKMSCVVFGSDMVLWGV